MRCSVPDCNITSKHPQKTMCWRDFGMCKYHAYEFYPEAYDGSGYRPVSSQFMGIVQKIENKVNVVSRVGNKKVNITNTH